MVHWQLGSGSTCSSREGDIYSLLLAFSEAVASSSGFMYVLEGREEACYISQ